MSSIHVPSLTRGPAAHAVWFFAALLICISWSVTAEITRPAPPSDPISPTVASPSKPIIQAKGAEVSPAKSAKGSATSQDDTAKRKAVLLREMKARQNESAKRRGLDHIRAFVDDKGVTAITNKPDKYRNKAGFTEIALKYDPIVVAPRYKKKSSPTDYSTGDVATLVRHYAGRYGLEESLVFAVIKAESNFDPRAVSSAGARGLMQLMPGTASDMGVVKIEDPAQNIAGGTQYLAKLLNYFKGDFRLALAAYNAGPETVKNAGGIPNIRETQNYVRNVLEYRRQFAGKSISPTYSPSAKKRAASYLPPVQGKYYTIHFRDSDYTQRAEKLVDADPYYYLLFNGRTSRVRKDHVKLIEEPV